MNSDPPRGWKPPKKRDTEPPPLNRPAIALLRVILVDNLASWRQKMKGWITENGANADAVLEASTGEEAMELLAHEQYDIDAVICEFDDEAVNGAGFLATLRSKPETKGLGFVAMCGNDPGAIREAKSSGASEVLVKPVTAVSLLQSLSSIQRSLKPRTEDTKRRLQEAASHRPQSTKLSSTIASELRAAGKLGKYSKVGAVIATGPFLNRLYWVEQGLVFVREVRGDGTIVEYRATPGRFFGEAAFVGETLTELRAVTETPVTILGWQEAESVTKTMQRLPILSHYFKTITTERHRNNVVPDLSGDTNTGGIGGTIESLPFPDLMQMMLVTKKTGILRIDSGGESAILHLHGGHLRHAESGAKQADPVIWRICSWAGGRFAFSPQPDLQGPETITGDVNFVIMEGLRRRDEGISPDA